MENATDMELVARIRRSDENAFYVFCHRHWKSLYARALVETSNEEEAFERVKGLFAACWDRRSRLPEMTTTVEDFLLRNGFGDPEGERAFWRLVNVMAVFQFSIRRLPSVLNVIFGNKHLRYK